MKMREWIVRRTEQYSPKNQDYRKSFLLPPDAIPLKFEEIKKYTGKKRTTDKHGVTTLSDKYDLKNVLWYAVKGDIVEVERTM